MGSFCGWVRGREGDELAVADMERRGEERRGGGFGQGVVSLGTNEGTNESI